MSANGEEINRREVAWRLFASEFRDADYSYAESDEERAPNYVVTPTGARVNRLFVVGVLTEVEYVSDDYLRARIVDPTGAFVVYAGQYQPEALTFLESADTPMFVAVTGKARTFQPDDSDIVYTSIRPESISEVEATTRDNWVVTTAQQSLERIATMADAIDLVERGDDLQAVLSARNVPDGLAAGIPLALDHYGTTEHYLAAVRDLALDAARVVAGEREEVRQNAVDPADEDDEPVALGLDNLTLATGDAQPVTESVPESASDESPETTSETDPATEADAAADAAIETESDTEAEREPEAATESETETTAEAATVGSAGTTESEPTEPDSESEPEPGSEPASDPETESESDADAGGAAAEAEPEPVDTDEMYELSEEERQEVEENYDVGFSTADEIEGEAGIEPEAPQPDGPDEGESEADNLEFEASTDTTDSEPAEPESTSGSEAESEPEPEPESEESAEETAAEFEAEHEDEPEPSEEESEGSTIEDLEDAVVETMQALGDGAGADHDELVQTVMDEHDVDQDTVEDAIDDALMSGRCYESGENELTAI